MCAESVGFVFRPPTPTVGTATTSVKHKRERRRLAAPAWNRPQAKKPTSRQREKPDPTPLGEAPAAPPRFLARRLTWGPGLAAWRLRRGGDGGSTGGRGAAGRTGARVLARAGRAQVAAPTLTISQCFLAKSDSPVERPGPVRTAGGLPHRGASRGARKRPGRASVSMPPKARVPDRDLPGKRPGARGNPARLTLPKRTEPGRGSPAAVGGRPPDEGRDRLGPRDAAGEDDRRKRARRSGARDLAGPLPEDAASSAADTAG